MRFRLLAGFMMATAVHAAGQPAPPPEGGFTAEEELVNPNGPYPERRGSINGLVYRYYADSSGSLRSDFSSSPDVEWSLACRNDAMTDQRSCTMSNPKVGLFLRFTNPRATPSLCVTDHDYPGVVAMIRVDGQSPVSLGTSGCTIDPSLLAQLENGTDIVVRSQEWPNAQRDRRGVLTGFNDALAFARWLYDGVPSF